MRGATVGEPCNSLGLVAHRPEWCCVGFSVMGQNGPSCGTQTINTLLWSAFHIGYPRKQHHTAWHKNHSHAHAQTTHTHTLNITCIISQMIHRHRSMYSIREVRQTTELPHGGIKHYRWELQRMCKHADKERLRDRQTERSAGIKKKEKKSRKNTSWTADNSKKHKKEEVALMKTKGGKLTYPAAGRVCPPSPGAGLAGLC